MRFIAALNALEEGKFVARAVWRSNPRYLSLKTEKVVGDTSLHISHRARGLTLPDGKAVYIIFSARREYYWIPSQECIFANDWEIVQPIDTDDATLLSSDVAERRRQEPIYKAIQKAETFLHKLMENGKYQAEAGEIHGELHEAAYIYVTRGL